MKTKAIYAAIDVPDGCDEHTICVDAFDSINGKSRELNWRILPEPQPVADEWFEALNRELVLESERAIEQRDKFFITWESTAGHGGSHDTFFSAIVRKYFAMLNTESRPQGDAQTQNDATAEGKGGADVGGYAFAILGMMRGMYMHENGLKADEFDSWMPGQQLMYTRFNALRKALYRHNTATTAAHGVPDAPAAWIDYDNSGIPCNGDDVIEVELRNGDLRVSNAKWLHWTWSFSYKLHSHDGDIVRWRPYVAPSARRAMQCSHEGYSFKKHGRCCPNCNRILTDFGD